MGITKEELIELGYEFSDYHDGFRKDGCCLTWHLFNGSITHVTEGNNYSGIRLNIKCIGQFKTFEQMIIEYSQ